MNYNELAPIYLVVLISLALIAVIGGLWLLSRRLLWAFHFETFLH